MLLRKYKNRIFKNLQELGLKPDQFIWSDISYATSSAKNEAFEIALKESKLSFIIGQSDYSFDRFFTVRTEFSPGYPSREINIELQNSKFLNVMVAFKEWIEKDVKRYFEEMNTPDLWEAYAKSIQPLNFEKIDYDDDSNFNDEEKEHIKIGLNEIKILVAENFDFTENQLKIIDQRLNYLQEATNRLNKTDWKSVAISTVFSVIINLGVDTQTGQAIIDLFKKVFDNLPQLPF